MQWYLGAPLAIEAKQTLFIHPYRHRPLTAAEWDAIAANSGDSALLRWLDSLAGQTSATGAPQAANAGQWRGYRTVLDWRQRSSFPALAVYPYSEAQRRKCRLFNVDDNGKVIVPWQLIFRQQQGQITYDSVR